LKLRAIVGAILLFQLAHAEAQQRPNPKGSIEGIVVRVGTNDPIAGARLRLNASNPGTLSTPATATTDARGVFAFREVEAGSYRIVAEHSGYVRQEYGRRDFNSPGTAVRLSAGQSLTDLSILLTPAGSIDGRITDSAGNPAVAIPVELLRKTYNENGQRILHVFGSTRTNDRGEYRFYWVTPGRYYLNAGSAKGSIGLAPTSGNSPNEMGEEYEPAYYPGVTDMGQAAVIEVRPGDQMSAIDLRVNRRRSYRIRGRVIDEGSGRFPATASISVTVLSPTGLGNTLFSDPTQTYDSASGIFEIRNIAPGSYLVGAALPERSSDSSEGPAMLESAVLVAVTVTDSDVDNVVLAVRPPTAMPGRLRIDGSQPLATVPGIAQMRVELEASINGGVIPNAPTPDAEFRWVSADGAFILSRVAQGEYRVRVTELPPDYYIKDVRFNQTDTLNAPMHFSGDVSAPLEVLLSPNGGRIDGTVINEKQNLMAGIEAVLIPDRRRDRTDLYKTATTDETGHFTIRGIPPGDYKVFAWDGLEEFGYYDSDLIRLFEQKGTPVRIVESAKESLEMRIIPPIGK